MTYNAASEWESIYSKEDLYYPAEGVIRILKGKFPGLDMERPQKGQKILDAGCGDGRHFPLFRSLELDMYGSEISENIVLQLQDRMESMSLDVALEIGTSESMPFPDKMFDYLLSWNSCYYMSDGDGDFKKHVLELARVVKPGGYLICSIPKSTNFIFDKSKFFRTGYHTIANDYFGLRNGEIMRYFESWLEIKDEFSPFFSKFSYASEEMDWFGLNYHWHIFVAQKL